MAEVYRAETVGSLLRPPYLMDAREKRDSGAIPAQEFKTLEDTAVRQAIARQEAAGLPVVSDGELRRMVFVDHLLVGLEGLVPHPGPPVETRDARGETAVFQSPLSVGERLRRKRMITVEEYAFARACASVPVKVTLPSPFMLVTAWSPDLSPAAYPDPWEMFLDVAALLREEAHELAAMGCSYIQVDAPELLQVNLVDSVTPELFRRAGLPADRVAAEGIEVVNSIVADLPAGVARGLHVCRANYQSKWLAAGGYERAVGRLLGRARFDTLLLEYDDDRSGDFAPLAEVSEDKRIVLGLVSTKSREVEDVDAICARVRDAAQVVGMDRLAISPQCGFATDASGNMLTEQDQDAKLRVVVEAARRCWS